MIRIQFDILVTNNTVTLIQFITHHELKMNLSTLKTCYEAEFPALEVNNDDGVPLEHLVSAIHGVTLQHNFSTGVGFNSLPF